MKNTRQKGADLERRIEKILQEEGWLVHRALSSWKSRPDTSQPACKECGEHPRVGFSLSNDLFGCFDLVAVKQGHPTRWIQAHHGGSSTAAKRHKIKDLGYHHFQDLVLDYHQVEIWVWVPRRPGVRSTLHNRWKVQTLTFAHPAVAWRERVLSTSQLKEYLS